MKYIILDTESFRKKLIMKLEDVIYEYGKNTTYGEARNIIVMMENHLKDQLSGDEG